MAINTQSTAGQKSGFGFYVNNLLKFGASAGIEYVPVVAPKGEHRDTNTPRRFLSDQITFPWEAWRSGAAIIHQPCFSQPLFARGKRVVTIHDIIPVLFPGNLAFASRLFFARFMPFSYGFADHYITDSEHSKRDIIEHLKIPAEKITVTPLAAGPEFRPLRPSEQPRLKEVLKKYGITQPYIIHVATLEPRKNLEFLLRAFHQAIEGGLTGQQLVITGKKGWRTEQLFALVQELHIEDAVVFTGYADDDEIPFLYSGATASVFPSLYEGFGLPPLEAMQSGAPMICSNASSLPEVVGGAGILLSPHDNDGWAEAITRVCTDRKLQEKMRRDSLAQAAKFSWEKTAELTAQVYRKLLA